MKGLNILFAGILSLSLLSFKSFDSKKVELMKDGNYKIPSGVLSSSDVNHLAVLTTGTHVRAARIIMPATNDGGMIVWKISNYAKNDPVLESEVRKIMKKYLE